MTLGITLSDEESQITEMELVEKIQMIRAKNNINWMNILKLALKGFPEETKQAMRDIHNCDKEINELTKLLAMEECFDSPSEEEHDSLQSN